MQNICFGKFMDADGFALFHGGVFEVEKSIDKKE